MYIGKIGPRDNLFIIIRLIGEKLSARSRVNSRKKVNLSRKRNETYERILYSTQAYSERNVSLVQMLTLLYSSADLCAMGLTLM